MLFKEIMNKMLIFWLSCITVLLVILYGWMLHSFGTFPQIKNDIISNKQQIEMLQFYIEHQSNCSCDTIIINNYINTNKKNK